LKNKPKTLLNMNLAESGHPSLNTNRGLAVARPETDQSLIHISVAGGIYTILLTGRDTDGRYSLIDMLVPPGGGPASHEHDFEEMFSVLEGEIEVSFRGEKSILKRGEMANVPANTPHHFRNITNSPARVLCFVSPAGLEDFFLAIGTRVESRTSPPPILDDLAQAELKKKAIGLAPKYGIEIG